MDKPQVICIDLDGVLVDLHYGLVKLFGDDPEKYSDAQWAEVGEWGLSIPKGDFWGRVRSQGIQWWLNLPKLPWTDELWEACNATGATCVILTTPAPFPESSYGKWQWVNDQLHTNNILMIAQVTVRAGNRAAVNCFRSNARGIPMVSISQKFSKSFGRSNHERSHSGW